MIVERYDNPTGDPEIAFNFLYEIGALSPNYPMPALRMRTFNSLVKLGFTSAENNFDVDTVFEYYIKY